MTQEFPTIDDVKTRVAEYIAGRMTPDKNIKPEDFWVVLDPPNDPHIFCIGRTNIRGNEHEASCTSAIAAFTDQLLKAANEKGYENCGIKDPLFEEVARDDGIAEKRTIGYEIADKTKFIKFLLDLCPELPKHVGATSPDSRGTATLPGRLVG